MGGSSFPTVEESVEEHEISYDYLIDGYLTEKEQQQIILDEEALRETLKEQAMAEKEQDERIRQEQAHAKLRKQSEIHEGGGDSVLSAQEYMKKVVEDVGDDEDFKSGSWVSATDYVNANGGIVSGYLGDIKKFLNKGKLDKVVAIVKSCSLNLIGDLTVTMKDISGTIHKTIHHKVIGEGGYEKDITVGAALILANVSVFSHKPSMHTFNITQRNVVKVFRKDTVPESGSGSGSG
uniref:Homologous recombination OB-fold protein OB-fold domain-containing protein n=1 Tax=Tanacetum cinerariifolium TaxID=118510 RepID=A0A6L2NW43_TANCI|nr:hypothetical protein [Tanacetum cinerariifolium]